MLDELVRATQSLASRRIGALIVLERDTSLNDQIEAGTPLDAVVSKEMLTSVFQPQSPLHDGAVLIRQGRIASAGCILPLTVKKGLPEGVGTRHRAAVGITEETDATVIVVSEETGSISVVMRGDLVHDLDPSRLRLMLADILTGERSDLQPRQESGEEADETEPVSEEAAVDAPDTVRARTAG